MNLNLVKLSHYNIPHLVERQNQDWVSFGQDNLYPNYLLDLFLGSAINGALIKSIGAMIYGEGLAATNVDDNTDPYREVIDGKFTYSGMMSYEKNNVLIYFNLLLTFFKQIYLRFQCQIF